MRFSSLGDVVLATAAVRTLRAAWPRARITFLTKDAYAPLLKSHPAIDAVTALGEGRGHGILSLAGLCRGMGRFDVLFDLHRNLRSRICARVVRADRRARYRSDSFRRRLWVMGVRRHRMAAEGRHVVERYVDALRAVIPVERALPPEVHVPRGVTERAEVLLRQRGVVDPGKTAVFVPGARWPNKRWTGSGFAAVARRLSRERGLQPVIVGDVSDRRLAEETAAALAGDSPVNLTDGTDLLQLAAVLKMARIVVGNDSGPGHLAAAVGTPVVSIFGPTVESFGFSPVGLRSRSVSLALDCRPCSLHGGTRCPRGRRACMEDLAPGRVLEAVDEVMSGR